ncbi:MAG: aminotransferase class V-fold PLP-dependent enzyme [Candidatus Njordarchaeales archaeon]
MYGNLYWRKWYDESQEVKKLFSRLINASPEEVSLIENTSMGLNLAANSIKWEPGDNIVINDLEFPTNIFPWQVQARKHGLEIRVAKNRNGRLDIDVYEKLVDDHTKVIALSWVEFSNGYVHDLKALSELAHTHGAYLVVDGIQGVGALKIDVRETDVDVIVCGAQKWLMGLPGTGLMYIKKSVLDELEVSFGGWLGDEKPFEFAYREYSPVRSARRFELGTPNFVGYYVLKSSLELILSIGINNIQNRDLELAGYLIEKVQDIAKIASPLNNGKPESPIISLEVPDAENIVNALWNEDKIRVAARMGRIRVSPHFYNNEEDIDKLVEALRKRL